MLSVSLQFRKYYLNLLNGLLLVNVTRLLICLLFMMTNCFLVCVSGPFTAYIIYCLVNVTLDTILGIEDILLSWFLIILVLLELDVALLFVCCLIRCKHLRLSDVNKHTYLLTYLSWWRVRSPWPKIHDSRPKSKVNRQCYNVLTPTRISFNFSENYLIRQGNMWPNFYEIRSKQVD